MTDTQFSGSFHLHEIAAAFPDTAETMLLDTYLIAEAFARTRVFRVYREVRRISIATPTSNGPFL